MTVDKVYKSKLWKVCVSVLLVENYGKPLVQEVLNVVGCWNRVQGNT